MSRIRRFSLIFSLFVSCAISAPTDSTSSLASKIPDMVHDFMSNASNSAHAIADLNFFEHDRLGIPLFGADIGFSLGGVGAGSLLEPFPPGGERIDVRFRNVDPSVNDLLSATTGLLQDEFGGILQGTFGSLFKDVIGEQMGLGRPTARIEFESDSAQSTHWLDRFLDFKVTPGLIYGVKVALLVKHYVQHGRHDDQESLAAYVANFAVLTIRLLRTWERDSKAKGGMKAVLRDKAPMLAQVLTSISAKVTQGKNVDFLLNKIERFWQVVVKGDGITFDDNGEAHGFGFNVSGFECNSADAAVLGSFFSKDRFAAFMKKTGNGSFLNAATEAVRQYTAYATQKLQQANEMDDGKSAEDKAEQARLKKERDVAIKEAKAVAADAKKVRDAFVRVVEGNKYRDFGRIDPARIDQKEYQERIKPLGGSSFAALFKDDKPLADESQLPKVVRVSNKVLYCSHSVGFMDSAYLVSAIFFKALWEYLDVMNGAGESQDIIARVKETRRKQNLVQRYLNDASNKYLTYFGPALLTRPTANVYQLAGKIKESAGGRNTLNKILGAAGASRIWGIKLRMAIAAALLNAIKDKAKKTGLQIPALPARAPTFTPVLDVAQLEDGGDITAKVRETIIDFKAKAVAAIKGITIPDAGPLRLSVRNAVAQDNKDEVLPALSAWADAFVKEQERQEAIKYVQSLSEDMLTPIATLKKNIEAGTKAIALLNQHKLAGEQFSIDEIQTIASRYRRRAAGLKKEELQELLRQVREAMVAYCGLQHAWRAGMQSFFTDQWAGERGALVQRIQLLQKAAINRRAEILAAASSARAAVVLDGIGDVIAAPVVDGDPPSIPHFISHPSGELQEQLDAVDAYLEKLEQRIGQVQATTNKNEILTALEAELTDAETEVSVTARADGNEPYVAARNHEGECRKRVSLARGREYAQDMMMASAEAMRIAGEEIAAINNEKPSSSTASKKGVARLNNEVTRLKNPHFWGGNPLTNFAVSTVKTLRAASPVGERFKKRLEMAYRTRPRVKWVAALLRALASYSMPGLLVPELSDGGAVS